MKTSQKLLIALTVVFAAFMSGLFIGRNLNRTPVQIHALPAVTNTAMEAATAGTAPADTTPANTAPTEPQFININTATSEQLQTLPGIGPVIAGRIIAYRESVGAFQSVGELMNVSGIGEKKLEAVWDLVTIGG